MNKVGTTKPTRMRILAIETSCDETALALLEARGGFSHPKFTIIKNLVASQIKIHAPFGGVVPNLAKREHIKNLPLLWEKMQRGIDTIHKIDAIAVTVGPGLEPALWAGIEFAKKLSGELTVPLIATNHLEGHLYSFLLTQKTVRSKVESQKSKLGIPNSSRIFPAVALIVSGGHTVLLKVDSLIKWKRIGETRDDAAGEAFDKVARLLDLPYPGGPEISRIAKKGNPAAVQFPRPMVHDKNYDFSFSGLKTSVLYFLRNQLLTPPALRLPPSDIAASFETAAVEVLTAKTMRAAREYGAASVMLSGGVAANEALRKSLRRKAKGEKINFFVAPQKFNTDNATMIAVAGYFTKLRWKKYPMKANGGLGI